MARLPIVDLTIDLRGQWIDEDGKLHRADRHINLEESEKSTHEWLPVHADQEYTLQIKLQRNQLTSKVSFNGFVNKRINAFRP